jgi:hypothetical protein
MSWFLRSAADGHNHCGKLRDDGLVVASCGAVFVSKPLAYGRISFRGEPLDPDQVSPDPVGRLELSARAVGSPVRESITVPSP